MPGQDLVEEGLADLRAGGRTAAALLVATARMRLAATGVDVPDAGVQRPGHALYELLASEDPATAHGRYNALIRRLVSYLRAAEHATAR
jgi:hypothetical protein